jgi:hypothetical protein
MISSAVDTPTVTDKADNDFFNGTLDNVQVLETYKGNELRLDANEDCAWQYMKPVTKPPPRDIPIMAAVYGTDKIVVYGGRGDFGTRLGDTWIYDLSDNIWTERFPDDDPGPRDGSSMATIWGTDKVMFYGGAGTCANDTWIYDLSENNWTRKYPVNHPDDIAHHSMTSICNTDKVLLFGGIYYNGGIDSNDTWIYDLSDNNWTQVATDPTPDARSVCGLSFIYYTDKILLFGGGIKAGPSFLNDTWVYDVSDNKWTNTTPTNSPEITLSPGFAALNGTDKVVMFCFSTSTGLLNRTWVYDLSENTWTEKFTDSSPTWRGHPRMASVFGTNEGILFGGHASNALNETWKFKLYNYYYNGNYISPTYYIGQNVSFRSLGWNGSVATNTSIKFQLRTANSELELNSKPFVGFDGTPGSYYTISPSSTWLGHNNQSWMQYKAYLSTTNYNETPILRNASFIYNYWPNTTLVDPNYGSIRVDNRPTFEWNFTDRDSISQEAYQVIIDDDSDFQSINYDSGVQFGNSSTWPFPNGTTYTELSDGIWYWKARTKDNDGDWGLYSEPWKVIIDTGVPVSVITQPENNVTYNHLECVSGTAIDPPPGTEINKVEISLRRLSDDNYWDGIAWVSNETWLLASGTNDWFYNISFMNWPSGTKYLINSMRTDNATKEFWHNIGKYRIQSRAIDNASNEELPSFGNIFTYDSEEVIFTNPKPSSGFESSFEKVEVGITISDLISGVDAQTIEYKVSMDTGKSWSAWTPVHGLENGSEVNVTLNLSFENGTGNMIKWRASDIAGNGPTESKVYFIKVNTWLQTFIPRVRLWMPPKGTILPSTSVALHWRLENTNLLNVTYDLYFDTVKPVEPRERGISSNYWEIDNLISGETYYWTIIPRTDSDEGYCVSGTWEFTVDISVPYPKVKLISPENGSILPTVKPILIWETEYVGSESISYDVYLDTNPEPINFTTGHSSTRFTPILNLKKGETYYWKVVPWAGKISGLPSEVWSFSIKKDVIKRCGLNLSLITPTIEMLPSTTKQVKARVTNVGSITDEIILKLEVPLDSGVEAFVNEPKVQNTNPGESAFFDITVTLSKNTDTNKINITVIAISGRAPDYGLFVEERAELIIKILEIDKEEPAKTTFFTEYWNILLIIFILILIVITAVLVKKHKDKAAKPKPQPEEAVTVKPGTIPEAVISVGQAPPPAPKPQLPETTSTSVPSPQIAPATPNVPTLASSTTTTPGQVPEKQQIPQAEGVPQLPPAENQNKIAKKI